ncbi:MAG: hypothetical protein RLZZ262_2184, partial [Bacteroidota bacterium]
MGGADGKCVNSCATMMKNFTSVTNSNLSSAMKCKGLLLVFAIAMIAPLASFGQLVVNENATIAQMTTAIQGTGVTITNMVVTSGANQQISSFTNVNQAGNPLTIPNGILLSTGRGTTAVGPNNTSSASTNNGIVFNDADLLALEPFANRDVVILEFDVVPITDTLQLVFQFGSEEYPEYVCGGFNDAFAFFVSGPGIAGPFSLGAQNFAQLPSGTYVSIDNVNNVGTCAPNNSAFYIPNIGNAFLQADGMTTRLNVRGTVQPCQTYHVKCALADAGDHVWDSWVFLDGFSALGQNLTFAPATAGQQLIEGCNSVRYNLTRAGDLSVPITVNLTYGGTATSGVDYTSMPSSVTFAAGQSMIPLYFDALGDGLAEVTENINITAQWNICATSQSASYTVPIINRTVSITCPSNITTNVAAGTCTAPVTYTTPTGTENCGSCSAPTTLAGFTYLGTYNNHKYFRSNASFTWTNARANALDLGGHLATLSSAGENAFLAGLGLHWIGYTDQAVEGTWVWTNGEPVVYTNWFAGEPNNAANDDYARINWAGSNQWDDQPASTTAPYILEFDCPVVTRTAGLASGDNFPVGTTLVTHVATDDYGNTANCSFTVTVVDNIAPTISCPANIGVFTSTTSCSASVAVSNPTFADNCAVTRLTWAMTGATVATSPGTGINYVGTYTFNLGTTAITYTARDAAGNIVTCSFNVTVTDNVAPTISCPGNASLNTSTTTCNASYATPAPTISDNCSTSILTWSITGATTANSVSTGINYVGTRNFNTGVSTVSYVLTDGSGNTATCSYTVTVVDNVPPVVTCPANIVTNVAAGACSRVVATTTPSRTDNCAPTALSWIMTGTTTGSSPTTGTNQVGTTTFNQGVTTIEYTAYDAAGNTGTCTFTVTVNDNVNPTIICPATQTLTLNSSCAGTLGDYRSLATVADNCTAAGSLTVTQSPAVGTAVSGVGTTVVTLTVTDASGNSANCTFNVNRVDTTVPTITCPSAQT